MENIQQLNAASLRIGNLLQVGNEIEKLELVDFADMYENSTLIHYQPIPLTEEWLLKLGFTKSLIFNSYYINSDIEINIFDNIFWYDTKNDSIEIQSVHELQNLFYALTKRELTYERPTN
jgi:hypothetical protein